MSDPVLVRKDVPLNNVWLIFQTGSLCLKHPLEIGSRILSNAPILGCSNHFYVKAANLHKSPFTD